MSYEPTNWKTGDVVTSAKLNKLEEGVATAGGGGLTVSITQDGEYLLLNKTYTDVLSAVNAGKNIDFIMQSVTSQGSTSRSFFVMSQLLEREGVYGVILNAITPSSTKSLQFISTTADGELKANDGE